MGKTKAELEDELYRLCCKGKAEEIRDWVLENCTLKAIPLVAEVMQKIPNQLSIADEIITIEETKLDGKLGCIDTAKSKIYIETNQPPIGKVIILIHEMLHLVDEQCKAQKVYKKGLTEKQIENVAGVLTLILLQNDLLTLAKFSRKEIDEFVGFSA